VYGDQSLAWDIADTGPGLGTCYYESCWTSFAAAGDVVASFNGIAISTSVSVGAGNVQLDEGAFGQATYYFSIVPGGGAPLEPIPVLIETHGQGSVEEGIGSFNVSTLIGSTYLASINYDGYAGNTQTFDVTEVFWLNPGVNNELQIEASAYGEIDCTAWPAPILSSEASAYVDPTITFDQALFDTTYPGSGITLSASYQIDYSPNLSTPEPSTLTLLGIGLVLAGYAGRRKAKGILS
jgi:hypothetical protein